MSSTPVDREAGSAATAKPADSAQEQTSESGRKQHWWSAPWRWLRRVVGRAASTALRAARAVTAPFRAMAKSPFRLAKMVFMATIGRDRGFGFWWLVVTIALAVGIGLILGILLSPVLGLLAAIGVGIWMLTRGGDDSDSDERESADDTAIAGAEPG